MIKFIELMQSGGTEQADAVLRAEAADLLREAIGGIEAWVREKRAEEGGGGEGGGGTAVAGPDWLRLQQRAKVACCGGRGCETCARDAPSHLGWSA